MIPIHEKDVVMGWSFAELQQYRGTVLKESAKLKSKLTVHDSQLYNEIEMTQNKLRDLLRDFHWDVTPPAPDRRLQTLFISLISSAKATEMEKVSTDFYNHRDVKKLVAERLLGLASLVNRTDNSRKFVENVFEYVRTDGSLPANINGITTKLEELNLPELDFSRNGTSRSESADDVSFEIPSGSLPSCDSKYSCKRQLLALMQVAIHLLNPSTNAQRDDLTKDMVHSFGRLCDSTVIVLSDNKYAPGPMNEVMKHVLSTQECLKYLLENPPPPSALLGQFIHQATAWRDCLVALVLGSESDATNLTDDIIKNPPKANIVRETATYISKLLGIPSLINEDGEVVIDKSNLTYENVSKALLKEFDLRVWGEGSIDSSTKFNGGYGTAVVVPLIRPREVRLCLAHGDDMSEREFTSVLNHVVVKELQSPEITEGRKCLRIVREARVWKSLKHTNVVPLLGVWANASNKGYLAPVMPYYPDGNLYDWACRNSGKEHIKETMIQCLQYLCDVARALTYMHESTPMAIHGDVRPDNVFLDGSRALICDFGLSRVLDGVRGLTTCVHGDLRFQPPEDLEKTTSFIETKAQSSVLSSDQEYAAGDIFSFALVFYMVVTGAAPWPQYSDPSQLARIRELDHQPENLDVIELDHWEFMTHCWRLNIADRPTARDALRQMNHFLEKEKLTKRCDE